MDLAFVLWLLAYMITVIIILLIMYITLDMYHHMYYTITYSYINCVKKHSHLAHITIYLIIICQLKYKWPGFHTFAEIYLCFAKYKCSPENNFTIITIYYEFVKKTITIPLNYLLQYTCKRILLRNCIILFTYTIYYIINCSACRI